MANFYRDSHQQTWGVMMQERYRSCGPACVAMTEVYYNYKSRIVENMEGRMRALSQKYPGRFTEGGGTSMENLVYVLREEGVKTFDVLRTDRVWAYLYKYANDNTPVIVEIDWSDWSGGGKHVIVCPWVYKSDWKCIFLDPGFGMVELVGSFLPSYVAGQAAGVLSGQIIVTKR